MTTADIAAEPAPRSLVGAAPAAPHDYLAGLDGLRAISITLVVLGHLGFGSFVPGGLGVTIFFFISGFLITRLLFAERERNGRLDLWRFYARRSLRLLPEMGVLLAMLAFVIGPALGQSVLPMQAVAALTYWTNYYVISGADACAHCAVTGHLWSLAVEEHFYLLMPAALMACAFAPRRVLPVLAVVVTVAALWRWTAFTQLHAPEIYTYKATECRIDAIAWGCLAAVLERSQPAFTAFVRARGWMLFLGGLALLAASLAWRDETYRATWRYSVQAVALMGVVTPLVVSPRLAPVVRVMEWAPLRWMGRRSYGAYLWHYVALAIGGLAVGVTGEMESAPHAAQLRALPLVLAATWTLAALSYALIYTPAQRLKPWLSPRRAAA